MMRRSGRILEIITTESPGAYVRREARVQIEGMTEARVVLTADEATALAGVDRVFVQIEAAEVKR